MSKRIAAAATAWVRDQFSGPVRQASVVHSGKHAVYVDDGTEVLAVVAAGGIRVPCAAQTRADSIETLLGDAPTVTVGDGRIALPGGDVRIGRIVDQHVPRIDPADAVGMRRRLGDVVPRSIHDELPTSALDLLRTADPSALRELIGLGSGLTPLGDDVVCGWLATMAAAEHDAATAVLARLDATTLSRTTALSTTLLRRAAAGDVLPEFAHLVEQLDADSGGDPRDAADTALRIGHTSGAGLVLGLTLALDHLATELPMTTTGFKHVELRRGAYADSVALLQVSKDVAAVSGVQAAQVAMATDLNRGVIAQMGFTLPESTPNDMIIAIRLDDGSGLSAALEAVEAALARATRSSGSTAAEQEPPRTTLSALRRSDAGLALVSVPGSSAVVEAADAIEADRDVMIFSDNVPVEQEIALKAMSAERRLLVMGPDCGTAVVDGIGLGFANAVRPGPVGVVAASGTGCQQLLCLLDQAGIGVSSALGVGGRDLGAEVGGASTREAMRRLDADASTELIVVVSKPPAAKVAEKLREFAATLSTPVQFALLGAGRPDLTAAAEAVLNTLGRAVPEWPHLGEAPAVQHGRLRGLFVGGTLCDEAMLISADAVGDVHSNIPLEPRLALGPDLTADGTVMIDFGDDSMTKGRAHPMIDPTLRHEDLARTAREGDASVVLLDVVLGHGAEADPAATLAPAIASAITTARGDGRELAVVVACLGTRDDPQQTDRQSAALAEAGAEVFASNAQATRRALSLIGAAR